MTIVDSNTHLDILYNLNFNSIKVLHSCHRFFISNTLFSQRYMIKTRMFSIEECLHVFVSIVLMLHNNRLDIVSDIQR